MHMRLPSFDSQLTQDLAACRAFLRDGSRSFYAASFLLPRRVREPASALYAFCRLADDLIDREGGSLDAVARLRSRLDRAYCGRPMSHPADRALAATVAAFAIPKDLPASLLTGLEWDASGRRYDDTGALHAYAARVAGTVGMMMALLMGVRDRNALARACDLGIAMQLTNIARDVGEDARAGRIYLPLDWVREAGIDPDAWLAAPRFTPRLGLVIARMLDAADKLYARADAGIAALPGSCRPGIALARRLYAEIGSEVRRAGYDSVSTRAFVTTQRKLLLVPRAFVPTAAGIALPQPCIAQAQFLLDAVPLAPPHPEAPAWWNLPKRFVRVIDLFDRLERREQSSRQTGAPEQAPI